MDLDSRQSVVRQFCEEELVTLCKTTEDFASFYPNYRIASLRLLSVAVNTGFDRVEIERIQQDVPQIIFDTYARHFWYSQNILTHLYLLKIPIEKRAAFIILIDGFFDDSWDCIGYFVEIFDEQGDFLGAGSFSYKGVEWRDSQLNSENVYENDFIFPHSSPPWIGDLPELQPPKPIWSEEIFSQYPGVSIEEDGAKTRYVMPGGYFVCKKITFQELLCRYTSGERDFSRTCLDTIDLPEEGELQGLDLSGIVLRDSYLGGFARCLEGINISGADLSRVQTDHELLNRANLSNSILRGTGFFHGEMDYVNLSGADLTGASFMSTNLGGANLSRANLSKARISQAYIGGTKLTNAIFIGARLESICFDERDLIEVNFRDAEIKCGTSFKRARLIRTSFRNATWNMSGWSDPKFKGAYFRDVIAPDGSIHNSVKLKQRLAREDLL